ncbi:MAG: tRNA glutamyl-Q(34) synthetase GluQRS [Steroidobacteraceae bacterium]
MKSSTATATTATDSRAPYVGRFAPTPSGDLHLGSLYTAAASYLDARAHGGRWLVRIEDLDRPREVAGAAAGILRALEKFGFEWDGAVVRQRERIEQYDAALSSLRERGLTFACCCSRSRSRSGVQLEDDLRYPGTCRNRAAAAGLATATRLRIEPGQVAFTDRIQGMYRQDVSAAAGDIILKRRDRIFAYVLAVVVDDAAQGITHIVRGADLLDNTPRQMVLQRLLGASQPSYAHVPLLTEPDDSKLAKSRRSVHLRADSPLPQLLSIFSMLGLAPPESLRFGGIAEAWGWAYGQWDTGKVPKRLNLRVSA